MLKKPHLELFNFQIYSLALSLLDRSTSILWYPRTLEFAHTFISLEDPNIPFAVFPVMRTGLMENGFLTFRGSCDRQENFQEMNAGEKEGKKDKRCEAPGTVMASDKCGQVSALPTRPSKIYTSLWIIPQPWGYSPYRFLLTLGPQGCPCLLGSCLAMDHLCDVLTVLSVSSQGIHRGRAHTHSRPSQRRL